MICSYPACFVKEEDGFSVVFPDLGNVATCGDTLEEAEFMATDLLAGYLSWLEEDGKEIPNPSNEESVEVSDILNLLDIGETEAFVKMVSVDVEEYAKEHF